jgi:hypothetical protein
MSAFSSRRRRAAAFLAAAAVAVTAVAAGPAVAADMPETTVVPQAAPLVAACGPREVVVLFDDLGRPTVPARTPYFTCVTGTTLLPGDIPPPPEYCCY